MTRNSAEFNPKTRISGPEILFFPKDPGSPSERMSRYVRGLHFMNDILGKSPELFDISLGSFIRRNIGSVFI